MYWPYAEDLERFYSSSLGIYVRGAIRNRIKNIWPEFSNSSLLTLGIGYCQPFVIYRQNRFISSPPKMNAKNWPAEGNVSIIYSKENLLPFHDNSFHRIIVSHTLEYTSNPDELMSEIWRVLAPEGKVLFILPNRSRGWAKSHITPFGYGTPYSKRQISGMLSEAGFLVGSLTNCLYMPPFNSYNYIRFCRIIENAICTLKRFAFIKNLGGVTLAEGQKRLFCPDSGFRSNAVVFKPVPAN